MEKIPNIEDQFIERNTNFPDLIGLLKEAFRSGSILVPQRHHHDFPNPSENNDSTMLLMPAWDPSHSAGVKVVTVSPNNSKYNLPSIQGVYLYFETKSGSVKAILDAKALTNKRTAAASALASTFLSRENSTSMLMIGTGALSKNLIHAHASVRPIKKAYIYGRSFEKAKAIANDLSGGGLTVVPVSTIEDKISEVDIISCATLSSEPLVLGKYLRQGQHIDMVGAYKKDMREADDEVLLKSEKFVDNFTGALKETGDLVIPLEKGVIRKEEIKADLFGLCSGKVTGRNNDDEITFFKSVGHALEDLVAAGYYYNQIV